jgi:hypothetical protein
VDRRRLERPDVEEYDDLTTRNEMDGPSLRPQTGGYYWFPTPADDGVRWSVLSCRQLGFGSDVGHVAMWPFVIRRLAVAWAREEGPLRRALKLCCYGLSRGRVTRPQGQFLVLHGDDAPVPEWQALVSEGFGLGGRPLRYVFDEHERTFPEHVWAVFEALGIPAARPGLSSRSVGN